MSDDRDDIDGWQLWQQMIEGMNPTSDRYEMPSMLQKPVYSGLTTPVLPVKSHSDPEPSINHYATLLLGDTHMLNRKDAQRLKRGEWLVDVCLDLHGYTRERAWKMLERTIIESHSSEKRLLHVITGKGTSPKADDTLPTGVLRQNLPGWLNTMPVRPLVLTFVEARPKDGGSGAFYILLKRNRP